MQELRAFKVFDYWKAMVLLGLELIGNVEDPWVGDFHFRDLRTFMNNCFATRAVHSVLRWLVLNMKMGILLNLSFFFFFFGSTHLYNLVQSLMGLVMCKVAGQKLFVFIYDSFYCMTFASFSLFFFFFGNSFNSIIYEFYNSYIFFISQAMVGNVIFFCLFIV